MIKLLLGVLLSLILVTPAMAAKPVHATIDLVSPATVHHGDTVTFAVTGQRTDSYVFTQCYNESGDYVFAHYSDASSGTAVEGPLDSSLWTSGGGNCKATLGHFAKNGFGRWVEAATLDFVVLP